MNIEHIVKQLEELGIDKDKIQECIQDKIDYNKLIDLANNIEVKEKKLNDQIAKFEKIANVITDIKKASSSFAGDNDYREENVRERIKIETR